MSDFHLESREVKTVMNIDEALNKIIFKYHLDQWYPHYRNMYEAEILLNAVVDGIMQNQKKAIFVGNDMRGIEFIHNISRDYANIYFQFYNRNETEPLEAVNWKEYDEIYIISFYGAEYIERWFRLHNIRYEWIYDIFEQGGTILQREFFSFGKESLIPFVAPGVRTHIAKGYRYAEAIQCELCCQRSKYENSYNYRTKRIALEKCLFLSLYMRNFIEVEKYVSLLMEYDSCFQSVWKEIQDLLNEIKRTISGRTQKDIVLYWLDCIPYGDEKDMPYLQNILQSAIVFENAYANVGYTNSTLRAMFLGKRDIEDQVGYIQEITRENSPVIQYLEEQGYHIKVISGIINRKFPRSYSSARYYAIDHTPCSMKLWDMVADMLSEKGKTLYIIHMMDGHSPYLNSRMKGDNYKDSSANKERYRLSRMEIDEQLAFFDSFVSQNAFRIYMSDHGRMEIDRYHIIFSIYHKEWKPRRIEGMFSILDFSTVLKQMIVNDEINEAEFIREYVAIGNMDWYDKWNIGKLIKNKEPLTLAHIGYTGILDKEYIYLRYKTGKEWLQKVENMSLYKPLLFYDFPSDICEPELLSKYRKLAGEYPGELIEFEQFQYTKYLYVLYNNILKHNHVPDRVAAINQVLKDYPDRSVAIRMGGITSSELYYVLSEENKRKIWGFIDNDKECLCSGLYLPVIQQDGIADLYKNHGIKAIMLPSYSYYRMLRKEVGTWPANIDVLDIYDIFEKRGIGCREDFYKLRGSDEDYNVGFPFGIDEG